MLIFSIAFAVCFASRYVATVVSVRQCAVYAMTVSVPQRSARIICSGRSQFFAALPPSNKANVTNCGVFVSRVSHPPRCPYLRVISDFLYRTHTHHERMPQWLQCRDTERTNTSMAKYIVWANGNTHNWHPNETATLIRHSTHQYHDIGQSERPFHRFVT